MMLEVSSDPVGIEAHLEQPGSFLILVDLTSVSLNRIIILFSQLPTSTWCKYAAVSHHFSAWPVAGLSLDPTIHQILAILLPCPLWTFAYSHEPDHSAALQTALHCLDLTIHLTILLPDPDDFVALPVASPLPGPEYPPEPDHYIPLYNVDICLAQTINLNLIILLTDPLLPSDGI